MMRRVQKCVVTAPRLRLLSCSCNLVVVTVSEFSVRRPVQKTSWYPKFNGRFLWLTNKLLKPLGLANRLFWQSDWSGWQVHGNYDVFVQASFGHQFCLSMLLSDETTKVESIWRFYYTASGQRLANLLWVGDSHGHPVHPGLTLITRLSLIANRAMTLKSSNELFTSSSIQTWSTCAFENL